jgi:1-acyl-sn-glycerol-3-phosphate acyltransferase
MLLGWRIEGVLPDVPKLVLIAAPHTSNWDFVVGLLAKFAVGIDAAWLGKHTLFRAPFGFLFRRWGGIPVNRDASQDMVAQVVRLFAERPKLILGLAPEGTRRKVSRWRTGFWHMAHGARVPILPIMFDWSRKAIRVAPLIHTREMEGDLAAIRALYDGVRGRS